MLMSVGGMVSFGHAAFFGLGAYAAALVATRLAMPMPAGIVMSVVAAGLAAVVIGWFCTRLTGVYLAFLTLAFAQILWAISVQWVSVTGGDNGILGVDLPAALSSTTGFYYFALLISLVALTLMRLVIFSPFGYTLRAARDSALRAETTGIHIRRFRLAAFVASGLFAGLSGGLIAYQRGRVFPNDLSISTSVDALVMVLLGGMQTVTGPVFGAAVYHLVRTELIRGFADHWRLLLGLFIVLLVVLFPGGIVGGFNRLVAALGKKRPA
jgi:branched-chain amino acid transport system permease protein